MRPVLIDDILALARLVRHWLPHERGERIERFLMRVHLADRARKRSGRDHPDWGNGSVVALACREFNGLTDKVRADASDCPGSTRYLQSVEDGLRGINRWKREQAARGGRPAR